MAKKSPNPGRQRRRARSGATRGRKAALAIAWVAAGALGYVYFSRPDYSDAGLRKRFERNRALFVGVCGDMLARSGAYMTVHRDDDSSLFARSIAERVDRLGCISVHLSRKPLANGRYESRVEFQFVLGEAPFGPDLYIIFYDGIPLTTVDDTSHGGYALIEANWYIYYTG